MFFTKSVLLNEVFLNKSVVSFDKIIVLTFKLKTAVLSYYNPLIQSIFTAGHDHQTVRDA